MFSNKKIFILGMAKSGYAVAKLLANRNNEIIITDMKDQDELQVKELASLGIKFVKTDKPEDLFDDSYNMVVKNPGVLPTNPLIKKAVDLGIPVLNEMEVAYHFLPRDIKIIGVTGSNGKTTTTTIIYEILKRMNKPVVLGGNIGYPLSEVVYKVKSGDILLLEISDHQLANFRDFKTDISVLTNLCPTHLDYHGSYEEYRRVKGNIFNHHTNTDLAIINESNNDSLYLANNISSTKKYFNGRDAYLLDDIIYIEGNAIMNVADIKIKGIHNYENIMAALLVVNEFGLNEDIAREFLKEFNGVEHRLEYVCNVGGVEYYNDSKSTNPTSTVTALNSFDKPIYLILGGFERKQDFNELDGHLEHVKKIYAIGECMQRVVDFTIPHRIPCERSETLENAFYSANKDAKSGSIILLSPASASWDQYPNFETRGLEFKKYCKDIQNN